MEYIQYADEELLHSDFDDKTLNLIADLMGPEVRDMLLVPVVERIAHHRIAL